MAGPQRSHLRLIFGELFNQPLPHKFLPLGLTLLSFGDDFNQPLPQNFLPLGLTSLSFGNKFNQLLTLQNYTSSNKKE